MMGLKEYKFAKLYEMSSGISSTKEQAGHGAPFASFSTVFNNYILPDELPDLMDTSEREQKTYNIKKGDILITRTSETLDELAMSSVALKDYPKATYSGFVKRLRPLQTDVTYDKFMAFYLRSPYFRKIVDNNTNMTLRASFNEDIFSYITILLPEYSVQKKIGDFLFTVYEKIKNNKEVIGKLEQQAQMIYDYWFSQFDFPDEQGLPYRTNGGEMEWNELIRHDIPKGWNVSTLDACGDFKNGINYEKDYIGNTHAKIVNVRNISNTSYFIMAHDLDDIYLDKAEVDKYRIEENDILIARSSIPGATRLMYSGFENCIYCGFVIRYRVYEKKLKNYLFYKCKEAENTLKVQSGGTIHKNVSQDTLKPVTVILPNDEKIIRSFNEKINILFEKIDELNLESYKLQCLLDYLTPLLVNGQVKLEE